MSDIRRADFSLHAPEVINSLAAVSMELPRVDLDETLLELVFLRASKINGYEYCFDMHAKKIHQLEESRERFDSLADWRKSNCFSAAERAALDWT